ncbi:dolichol kinase [Prochlorococcus marinus]|uniref:diacylglycerol/polyprenol kinase family protein n=1 Tax=Prochlorococcus marinus TaxID=1219 RepID=UPI002FBF0235
MSLSVGLKKLFPQEKELGRKIVHMGTGPIIPLAWWLDIPSKIAIPAATVITIGLLINYQFRFIASIESIDRKSFGTIAYGLSITLLLIFFWPNNAAAITAGVLVMAFGDGLAGLIGRKIISPSWMILNQKKSMVGTFTMAIGTGIVLYSINQLSGINLSMLDIFIITSIAVILEQISPLGIDNITVPIGVALCWQYFINH